MEYRKRCKVCGHIFCYTDEDLKNNNTAAIMSGLSAIGAIAGAFSGNWVAARANQANTFRQEDKQTDFYHCPNCNSSDLEDITNLADITTSENTIADKKPGISVNSSASIDSLIKRIKIFLEDQEFDTACAYCEHALDMDPENGELYLLKQLAQWKIRTFDDLVEKEQDITLGEYYPKIERYSDAALRSSLEELKEKVKKHKYDRLSQNVIATIVSVERLDELGTEYATLGDYKDSNERHTQCITKKNEIINDRKKREEREKKENEFASLVRKMEVETDRSALASERERLLELDDGTKAEKIDKLYADRTSAISNASRKQKNRAILAVTALILGIIVVFIGRQVINHMEASRIQKEFLRAEELVANGSYNEAIQILENMDGTESVVALLAEAKKQYGYSLFQSGNYSEANMYLKSSKDLDEDMTKAKEYCSLYVAIEAMDEGTDLTNIYQKILELGNYNNASELIEKSDYMITLKKLEGEWYEDNDRSRPAVIIHDGVVTYRGASNHFVIKDGKMKEYFKRDNEEYYSAYELISDTKMIMTNINDYGKTFTYEYWKK